MGRDRIDPSVQRILLWTGPALVAVLVVALIPLAHLIPPPSPRLGRCVGFYLPTAGFYVWLLVMTRVLFRMIRAADPVGGSAPAGAPAAAVRA